MFELTRYSEDDSNLAANSESEKLAVLEFELRRSRDTINTLREELRNATEKKKMKKQGGNSNRNKAKANKDRRNSIAEEEEEEDEEEEV